VVKWKWNTTGFRWGVFHIYHCHSWSEVYYIITTVMFLSSYLVWIFGVYSQCHIWGLHWPRSMGRRGRQTYKILKFVVGPSRLDCILTDGSTLDPVMRYGSICATNDSGEGSIIKWCWRGGGPFIYTTAYSSNFETNIVTRPGLVNLWCRKYFLGTWHSRPSQIFFYVFCLTISPILSRIFVHTAWLKKMDSIS